MPKTDPGSVRFVTLVDDEHGCTASFWLSWNALIASDLAGEQRIWRGGYAAQKVTSAGVVEGRNEATKNFLESSAEWLFFVDADMGWDPDALDKLMDAADPVERPIVGGLCFGFGPITDRIDHAQAVVKRPFPTIFDLKETDEDIGFRPRWGFVSGAVQKCGATGAAFLLIHRSVLEAMKEKWGEGWWDRIKHPKAKKMWGEDTSFCVRAGMLGVPIFVHAGVKTSHLKTIYATESTYISELIAQPAFEPVAVIVPVIGRPQNAAPFMRSLKASTGLAEVYAVCEEDDAESRKAWGEADANVISTNVHTFAEKVNVAYEELGDEFPWYFLVGDDVKFHPGWLDHAQQMALNTGAKVIGTNDLGTDRVMDGEHATHVLIARDYIAEQGATWTDGPGVVCHEGYRHGFVDDELVTVAKQRGTFVPALASIVEHMHPWFGKGDEDDIYKLGRKSLGRDQVLFRKRLKANSSTEVAA